MRIAIDGGSWSNRRGYGRFTRELVAALGRRGRHEYQLVIDVSTAATLDRARHGGVDVITVPLDRTPSNAASAAGWRSPLDLWRMARALGRAPADLVFFPSVYTFVPVPTRAPVVVTIHDVIAERWPALIFSSQRARRFWAAKLHAARWQADRILTVSDFSARGIRDVFQAPLDRIRVCGEAPSAVFTAVKDRQRVVGVLQKLEVDEHSEVIAYVGGMAPHKNLPALVRAFAQLASERPARSLVLLLVGDHQHDVFLSSHADVQRLVDRLCPGRVRFTGPLSDEDLAALFSSVVAVALPSVEEGFGLPAVEAAACGAAVVVTRASAMPEVLGEGALYSDPDDESTLRVALGQLLDDPALRRLVGERGAERARALSWEAAAARVEAVFEELGDEQGART